MLRKMGTIMILGLYKRRFFCYNHAMEELNAWSVFLKCLKRNWLETPLQLRRLSLHFCVDFP